MKLATILGTALFFSAATIATAQGKGHGAAHANGAASANGKAAGHTDSSAQGQQNVNDHASSHANGHSGQGQPINNTSNGNQSAVGPPSRPPGWDQGKKQGWGDCNVPPGLAKKSGCDAAPGSAIQPSLGDIARQQRSQRQQSSAPPAVPAGSATGTPKSSGGVDQRHGKSGVDHTRGKRQDPPAEKSR